MTTEPTVVRPDGPLSVEDGAREFDWLLSSFASRTPGIIDAIGVSSDGLLIASSAGLRRPSAEQLAAIVSGMLSLGLGASRCFGFQRLDQILVEMDRGVFLVASIADGSALGVVARKDADLGVIGYEMALLVERAGAVLTPEIVARLKRGMLQ